MLTTEQISLILKLADHFSHQAFGLIIFHPSDLLINPQDYHSSTIIIHNRVCCGFDVVPGNILFTNWDGQISDGSDQKFSLPIADFSAEYWERFLETRAFW